MPNEKNRNNTILQVRATPPEFLLEYKMALYEAASMEIIHKETLDHESFEADIYYHVYGYMQKTMKGRYSTLESSIRVLFASVLKRCFDKWDPKDLKEFIRKADENIAYMRKMEADGEIHMDLDKIASIKKVRENPQVKEVSDIWQAEITEAENICTAILQIKEADKCDPGFWQVVNDIAHSQN